jgi:hypothetical protein
MHDSAGWFALRKQQGHPDFHLRRSVLRIPSSPCRLHKRIFDLSYAGRSGDGIPVSGGNEMLKQQFLDPTPNVREGSSREVDGRHMRGEASEQGDSTYIFMKFVRSILEYRLDISDDLVL